MISYKGYVMKKGKCVDIDECEDHTHGCIGFAQCTNTPGGYTCGCNAGVTGPRCDQDINECLVDKKEGLSNESFEMICKFRVKTVDISQKSVC